MSFRQIWVEEPPCVPIRGWGWGWGGSHIRYVWYVWFCFGYVEIFRSLMIFHNHNRLSQHTNSIDFQPNMSHGPIFKKEKKKNMKGWTMIFFSRHVDIVYSFTPFSCWVKMSMSSFSQPCHCGRRPGSTMENMYWPTLGFSTKPVYQAAWQNAGVAANERRLQIAGKSYRAVLGPSRPHRSLRLEVNEQFGFSTRRVKPCSGTGSKPLEHLSTVLDNNFHYRR